MDLYNRFLGLICSVFNAYSGVLFLKDEKNKNRYNLAGYFSLGDDKFSEYVDVSSKGVVSWIIKNKKPLLIANFERRSESILDYYYNGKKGDIKSFMGCPLKNGLGVLCVDSKNKFSFTEKDQKILHQFTQIIFSVHNEFFDYYKIKVGYNFYKTIQLIENLKRNYQKWSDFLKKFLEVISQTTGFKYCFLATRDEKGEGFYIEDWNIPLLVDESLYNKKFSMDSGMIGWVFKKGKILVNDRPGINREKLVLFDKTTKTKLFKCVVCLPIFIYLKVRGVLVLAEEHPRSITEETKEFLTIISDQLSLFLENFYLKNKLKSKF